ncbi:DUF1461 domain-containing protein [Geovibrio thiophilus]|uniref:DUF1461 domain-containing protein n=1 Tax=Geovibrio thiophilus TaxID=139438 RepID=A0A3R5UUH5_9BACT|nr:DUF1461 domain-containing protein [Geovibrio thiophilus]QAR32855.1 DUF1461 domain-containing protein [Geovibrio thiophilus]
MKRKTAGILLNILFGICLFYTSAFFSWTAMSKFDFGYSAMYSMLDIDGMVRKYAPKNADSEKKLFVLTDREEHERLFGEISGSVNNAGEGLERIEFRPMMTDQSYKLLTTPEIQHLMDVSDVVFWFKISSYFFIVASLFCIIAMTNQKIRPARPLVAVPVTLGVLCLGGVLIYVFGAKEVFYFLHEVIFKEHQWFFYYEESLMTVLMHAPDIFGYIALMLVISAFVFYTALMFIAGFLFSLNRGIN